MLENRAGEVSVSHLVSSDHTWILDSLWYRLYEHGYTCGLAGARQLCEKIHVCWMAVLHKENILVNSPNEDDS